MRMRMVAFARRPSAGRQRHGHDTDNGNEAGRLGCGDHTRRPEEKLHTGEDACNQASSRNTFSTFGSSRYGTAPAVA
jgi:hypothetical protein